MNFSENEVQIAENQKDTSLVVRLKKRVCELKGLHSRKMKEVAMKNNEVRELRNTQKRSTQMKHEIESLRHRQAAQGKESICFFFLLFSFLFFFLLFFSTTNFFFFIPFFFLLLFFFNTHQPVTIQKKTKLDVFKLKKKKNVSLPHKKKCTN